LRATVLQGISLAFIQELDFKLIAGLAVTESLEVAMMNVSLLKNHEVSVFSESGLTCFTNLCGGHFPLFTHLW
jgi:hypothetical protein